jgi:hypothetical protein
VNQRRTDVLAREDFATKFFPEADLIERFFGVDAGGHGFGVGDREPLDRRVEQVLQAMDRQRRIGADDDHEAVGQ